MKRSLKILLPFAFLAIAAVVSWALVQGRPPAMQKPRAPASLLVTVETAQKEPVTFTVATQGSVAPRTQTTLMSEVAGQIIEVSDAFVSGGFFLPGDVLVRIDPRNYESAVKRARANVAKARTRVATENALAGYAYQDWQRLRQLNATRGPASDLTLRKPQLAEALAELESAEAELERAAEDLNRTVIRAPYHGMVREKIADVGQFVNSSARLAVTFAVDYAEIRLPLTQQDLGFLDLESVARGAMLPVALSADIGGRRHAWQGRIVRSEGVFDEQSRVLYVVAQIEDPYDTAGTGREPLRMGTFVTAEIEGRPGGELFVIPRHALHRGTTLWLVDATAKIYPREVSIVRSDEQNVYVSGGLDDGDRYCITPIDQPLPGMRVRFQGDGERVVQTLMEAPLDG